MLFLLLIIFILSFLIRLYINNETFQETKWRDALFFSFWTTVGLLILYIIQITVEKYSRK